MMPAAQPGPWEQIEREQVNPLLMRQAVHGDAMTVARLEMSRGCVVPTHSHPNEQISMVEQGRVKFIIDGEEIILHSGDVLHVASNCVHSAEALEDSIAVEVFSPRRDDWIRQG